MSDNLVNSSAQLVDFTRLRWRFVICAASFYVNAIAWGFISSTGIFEDALKTTYQLSSFRSTLPGSIQIATMSVLSVFASILTIKYGVRWITISGACIATIGSIVAAVIGDYWAFCTFYGFVVGAGETLMLVPAVLAIPPYFHSSRVSLATASAVSGASIGMLGIPFLLQYLLDRYGLRGATLLGSCLWLSVGLAGALFGKGATSMAEEQGQEEDTGERLPNQSVVQTPEDEHDHLPMTPRRSHVSGNRLMYSRRTSLLPISAHYHLQHPNSEKFRLSVPGIDEEASSHPREGLKSTPNSLSAVATSQTPRSSDITTQLPVPHLGDNRASLVSATESPQKQPDAAEHSSRLPSTLPETSEYFLQTMASEIRSLLRIKRFRVLIISMIFVWSFDETNFLFLTDLLKSSGQSEQRSTLLIAIIGVSDLIGQLFFGYLGDMECLDPLILWTCTSIVAGASLSITPLIGPYGMTGLYVLYGIHAFFLAAPNALGNVIMIEVVGMHRYAIAYGFSLLVSGSTSLFGYPLLGLLKDKTHRWTIPFALVGTVMICGGLVAGTMSFYRCYRTKRRKSKETSLNR